MSDANGVEVEVKRRLREAAIDVHLWSYAMTTQKAAAAARFAADRISELAGLTMEDTDEIAREAHERWVKQ